jgi:hypothetical protein
MGKDQAKTERKVDQNEETTREERGRPEHLKTPNTPGNRTVLCLLLILSVLPSCVNYDAQGSPLGELLA